MALVAYRHGLRAAELVDLRWSQVDLDNARLHVRRVKNGDPSVHALKGDEMRKLRELKRNAPNTEFVFTSERGAPFSKAGEPRDNRFGNYYHYKEAAPAEKPQI